jgi:hypothetical protein
MEPTDENPANIEFLYSFWRFSSTFPGLFQDILQGCRGSATSVIVPITDWSERKLLMAIQHNELVTLAEAKKWLNCFYQTVGKQGVVIQVVKTGVTIVYPGLENDPGNGHLDGNNPTGGNGQGGSDPDGKNDGGGMEAIQTQNLRVTTPLKTTAAVAVGVF